MLDDGQLAGRALLPEFLPLSARLRTAFGPQKLPSATLGALLKVALEPDIVLPEAADDLAQAVDSGLAYADAGRIRFRHPLIRAAIVHHAPPAERRNAHEALAAVMAGSPLRHAWHLAASTTVADESVAGALEEACLGNCTMSSAYAALVRAAQLSPNPVDRDRRLSLAAYVGVSTGRLDEVPVLLAEAGRAAYRSSAIGYAATAQLVVHRDGDIEAGYRLVLQALDILDDGDQRGAEAILCTLLLVSLYSQAAEPWELLNKVIGRFEPDAVVPFRLCYDAYVDPCRTADAVRAGLAQAFTAPSNQTPWRLLPLTFAAAAMDVMADYRYLLTRMIEQERDGGAIAMVIPGLMLLCHDSYAHGQWDEADALAQEGLDLATSYGYRLWQGQLQAQLALGTALRGDADTCRARCADTMNWAGPRAIGVTEAYARWAANLAAIGQGDFDDALGHVTKVDPPGVPGRWMVLDLAEAAVRSGRPGLARAHVAAAQRGGLHRISPRIELMMIAATALTLDDDQAEEGFEAALSVPYAARWPWELARVQLAYGQWLRRTRDTARARIQLRAAHETFERIGAHAFARRTRDELRAAGVGYGVQATTPTSRLISALTAQEEQIAQLAATGLTNKQIAARLVLSHRTIASHLHRLYPKLGIASRAGLRAALDAIEQRTVSG
jgi:DNA-binding CsgD family transcriptional regulator